MSCLQDPNWSELVKYCAARGAYKGAGAESLTQLVRGQYSQDTALPGETGMRGRLRRYRMLRLCWTCPLCSKLGLVHLPAV